MNKIERWEKQVKQLKTETYAKYLASKDPRVPWYAKALIFFVVAYTLSPIDLIPDFIPVLGYLDDPIITPLGIVIALKLIPGEVLVECREKARMVMAEDQPSHWATGVVIVIIWLLTALVLIAIVMRVVRSE